MNDIRRRGTWSFPAATRAALLRTFRGYADPDGLIRTLEATARIYDPAGLSKWIRNQTRTHMQGLRRVERDAARLAKTLDTLRGTAAAQIAIDFDDAIGRQDLIAIHDLHRSLLLLEKSVRTALAAPRRRGRPPDDLRRNLCFWFGGIIGGAPATRARRVMERTGDVADWRAVALARALPLILTAMGAPPHERDLPPLLKVAQAGAEQHRNEDGQQ